MHIVRALLDGPLGFNELGRAVGGCNPATLKVRLDRLEDLGLLRRTVHSQMPPRTSYELAPAGVDLQRVIDAIDAWAREHLEDRQPRRHSTRSRPPLSADRAIRAPSPRRARRRCGCSRWRADRTSRPTPSARPQPTPTAGVVTSTPSPTANACVAPSGEPAPSGTIPANYATALAFAPDGRLFWTQRSRHRAGLAERRVQGVRDGADRDHRTQRQLQRARAARSRHQPDVHHGSFRLRLLLRRQLHDTARHPLVRLRRHRDTADDHRHVPGGK